MKETSVLSYAKQTLRRQAVTLILCLGAAALLHGLRCMSQNPVWSWQAVGFEPGD